MIKAIIIDDEEGARITLNALLNEYCNDIEVISLQSNVPDGVIAINKLEPDLVFLDIEMPDYNGFELLNFFKNPTFEIIFVTAYNEYALRAFEISAIDYLLKPVEIYSLQMAVEKAKQKKIQSTIQQQLELMKLSFQGEEIKKIALPMSNGLLFVEVVDIILFEADRAYTNVFLKNGSRITVSKSMGIFEDILSNRPIFFRPHRSHLININYIKKYFRGESTIIMENDKEVSISRERKQEFEGLLKNLLITQK
jgi:two-component system LytT family response regulator